MIENYLPPAAKITTVLCFFALALLICHLAMVWPRNMTKKSWKRADYAWLAFAAIGLVSASASVRMNIAEQELQISEQRIANRYDSFRSLLDSYAQDDRYICRQFVKSEFSPPEPQFLNTQAEFDRVCAWMKQKLQIFPITPPKEIIDNVELGNINPMTSDKSLTAVFDMLEKQYSYYTDEVAIDRKLQHQAKPSEFETALSFLAPWLLSLALALRIAKVSGELRHEA